MAIISTSCIRAINAGNVNNQNANERTMRLAAATAAVAVATGLKNRSIFVQMYVGLQPLAQSDTTTDVTGVEIGAPAYAVR